MIAIEQPEPLLPSPLGPTQERVQAPLHEDESFWSYAKRRLETFNGVPNHMFYFHLNRAQPPS